MIDGTVPRGGADADLAAAETWFHEQGRCGR
jgi:hypothetical protein